MCGTIAIFFVIFLDESCRDFATKINFKINILELKCMLKKYFAYYVHGIY